jgi:hypothetical protein
MTVVAMAQYEMEAGIPSFQWNVQKVSGEERQGIRSKENKTQKYRIY